MVAGPVAAVGAVELLGSMWVTCRVGVGNANGIRLLMCDLPALLVLLAALMLPTYGLIAMRSIRWALVVSLSLAAGVVWVYLALNHNPGGDDPAAFCPPDNVPPWWPSWIPL